MADLNQGLTPRQHISLWLALERMQHVLGKVHVWGYQASRMQYWPGADLHPVPTLVLCLAGNVRVQARLFAKETERIDLAPGESLVIAPSVCHEHVASRAEYSSLQLGFVHQSCDYWLDNRESRISGRVPGQPYRQIMDSVFKVGAEQRVSLLADLLHTFLDERRHIQEGVPAALDAMQLYMQRNAHLPIGADDIVHASGLQHAQAYAIFCAYYAAPPFQILQQRRVHIAQAHLRAGVALTEAALCSGFTSRRNLARAFMSVLGEDLKQWLARELG